VFLLYGLPIDGLVILEISRVDEDRIKGRIQRKGEEFTLYSMFSCELVLTTGKRAWKL
jgi:hypothetical protein